MFVFLVKLTLSVWGEHFNTTTTLWSVQGFPHLSHSWTRNGVAMPWSFNTCKGLQIQKNIHILVVLASKQYVVLCIYAFILTCIAERRPETRVGRRPAFYLLWPADQFKLCRDTSGHFNDDTLHKALVGEAHLSAARSPRAELNPRYTNRRAALLISTHRSVIISTCTQLWYLHPLLK